MNRPPYLAFIALGLFFGFEMDDASAQIGRNRVTDRTNLLNTKISEQRVQRQTEIMRLERLLEDFSSRMTRMERQMLSMSRLPAITITEAEAELTFAQAQLKESESLYEKGESSEVRVARDRLALARARGQMDSARAAFAESRIIMELDVAHAERALMTASNEKEQLERMVAKGYTSSDGLRYQLIDVNLAEKQLQLARLRLQSQLKASGETQSPEDNE